MAPSIPSIEPASLVAGDSWKWDKVLSDYPAGDGWQLTYSFVGESLLNLVWNTEVTANVDTFEVRIPAASTNLKAGPYKLLGRVTDGTDTYTPVRLSIIVQANPATAIASKSLAKQMLEAIDLALAQGAGSHNVIRVSVNGRTTEFGTRDEALRERASWAIQYETERNPGARLSHAARMVG